MIVAEFFFPTYGSLGIGGLIAFVVGSLILFDADVPGMGVGRPLIAAFATVGGTDDRRHRVPGVALDAPPGDHRRRRA